MFRIITLVGSAAANINAIIVNQHAHSVIELDFRFEAKVVSKISLILAI